MDNTQIVILVGALAAQAVCMGLPFALGRRQGVAAGRQAGYEAAVDQLMPELEAAHAQCDSARAKLAEYQAELRRCTSQLMAERRRNAETQAELRMQLEVRHA